MDLKGIEVYRYTLLPSTLAAPTENPDNMCFCINREITKNCTMAGVLELSSCQSGWFTFVEPSLLFNQLSPYLFLTTTTAIWTGRPIFISLPHFLYGSQSLRENVLGLNPNSEHHFTYLDVEPVRALKLSSSWFLTVWSSNSDISFLLVLFHRQLVLP